MKSEFEKRAAQEAVDAVERRYRRSQEQARKMRGRRRFGRVFIIAVAAAAGLWAWQYLSEGDVSSFPSLSSLMSHPFFRSLVGSDDSTATARRRYGEALKLLLTGEVKLSAEMPDALKIKNAKPGARYAILTPPAGNGWFGLYELARGGAGEIGVSELSPVRDARATTAANLRAVTAGKAYLVAAGGTVYLFGSRNLADATRLRSQVRACLGR